MKVVKPSKLSVLTRPFEHDHRFQLGISVLAFVPLTADPASPLLPEVALWKFVAERLGPQAMLEAGVPKSRGEFLVHGSCFSPGGVPRPMVPVRAQVGRLDKALMVHGDRYWKPGRTPSEAQRFGELPLDWSRAFGGPKWKRNPLGRGHGESEYMGQAVQMLPNIELSHALVLTPQDKPEPAGLGALDISWPQRRKLAGTYDERWLKTLFPGMAADIDWRLFNLAQPDQQIDGFWDGEEDYRFDNMHPGRPRLEGQLPGLVARAFVTRRSTSGPTRLQEVEPQEVEPQEVKLEEVELSLRTLWFFPDAERAVLVYQGSIITQEDDAADILHLLVAAEHGEQPRPPEHYAAVLEARLDEERAMVSALREHELLPEGVAQVVEAELAGERALHQTERRLEHNLHRRALREHQRTIEQLEAMGLDPAVFVSGPPKPPAPAPTPDELPELVRQLRDEAARHQEREQAELEPRQAELRRKLEALGFPEHERERMLHQHETGPTGPPTFTAAGQRATMAAVVERTREAGAPTEALELLLADPKLDARWVSAETQLRDHYRRTAHLQDPAPPMSAARSEEARACVHESVAAGEDFSTLDLTGADLRGIDLVGADLSGAFLESVCLDGADLRRADLRGAVLAHASLRSARLDGANLAGANLGRSQLQGTSALDANLAGAELMGADLTGAVLRGSDLRSASLLHAKLTNADCSEIETEQLSLLEAEVTGLCLAGANLQRATFVKLDLTGADFSRARLDHATFVTCVATGVSFVGAALDHGRFVQGCTLDEADLTGASLCACNLRGTSLVSALLGHATLDGADLSECVLRGANLTRVVARGVRLDKADLTNASLLAANLMGASFLNATIHGADLRSSNLYGADMARVRSDPHVRLDEAVLVKVRIHPVHTPAKVEGPR